MLFHAVDCAEFSLWLQGFPFVKKNIVNWSDPLSCVFKGTSQDAGLFEMAHISENLCRTAKQAHAGLKLTVKTVCFFFVFVFEHVWTDQQIQTLPVDHIRMIYLGSDSRDCFQPFLLPWPDNVKGFRGATHRADQEESCAPHSHIISFLDCIALWMGAIMCLFLSFFIIFFNSDQGMSVPEACIKSI